MCSVSCGGGLRSRTRECENGYPGQNGCLGSRQEEGVCNEGVIFSLTSFSCSWFVSIEKNLKNGKYFVLVLCILVWLGKLVSLFFHMWYRRKVPKQGLSF